MCDDRKAIISVEQMAEIARCNQATAEQLRGIVEQLLAEIRHRAEEIAVKYRLPPEAVKAVRAAIRKDILAQQGIRDLHDLPESSLGAAMSAIVAWDSYSLIRKLRREMEGGNE